MTQHTPVEITVSAGACISACLLILLVPPDLLISFYSAAAIHELGHLAALFLFHVPVLGITFQIGGASIQTGTVSLKEELICALAGPVSSFLCLPLIRRFPLFSLCALVQGCFNLLPLYPMDGGRILRCIFLMLFPNHAAILCKAAALLTIGAAGIGCCILYLRTSQHLFLFISLYFLLQTCLKEKLLAKSTDIEYNIADF